MTEQTAVEAGAETKPLPFFAVSLKKLIIMSVCTQFVYLLYWFYKHWRALQAAENLDILPIARALFNLFLLIAFSIELIPMPAQEILAA